MTGKMQIVNPIEFPAWDELLKAQSSPSIFCSSSWARVLQDTYRYVPHYFTSIEGGHLKVCLPVMNIDSLLTGRRGVSLPFTDYCEPIFGEGVDAEEVLQEVFDYGRRAGWRSFEIKGGGEGFQGLPSSESFYGHTLELAEGEEGLLAGCQRSTRANIRKAVDQGVETSFSTSLEGVRQYYRLHCLTRKRHGLPPQPFAFFRNIFEHLIDRGQGMVTLAFSEGQVISGAVFLHFGGQAIYKFGASDYRYQHMRPNNLVMWEAIRWYAGNGYRQFCFGKTEEENGGLRRFKNGWGSRERIIRYYKYDLHKQKFVAGKSKTTGGHNRFFRMLPLSVSRLIGRSLYRHVG